MNITKTMVTVENDEGYFRVQFWINDWKFHSAKMPLKQAQRLFEDLTK